MTRTLVAAEEPENPYQARLREAIHFATTGQIPEQPERLTRRKRHIVIAADTWENTATVWFIRRGHNGEPVNETIRLDLTNGEWVSRGGGSSEPGADVTHRPTLTEIGADPSRQVTSQRFAHIPFGYPDGASWSSAHANIRFLAATEATRLAITDRPDRSIANHGYCLVAYNPKRPPTITAFDALDNSLGSFTPRRRH